MIYESGGKVDSRNGHIINEDLIIIAQNYTILMDGATGLSNAELDENLSSAEWFVKRFSKIVSEELEADNQVDLASVVRLAIIKISSEIKKKEEELGVTLEKFEVPSSSLIIVRKRENFVDIFSMGDSFTMIKEKNSSQITLFRDYNLCELDDSVIEKMQEIAKEQGISVKEARNDERIQKMLQVNRAKMNTPDGYHVASIDETAVDYATVRTYHISEIEKIFICSDGFDLEVLGLSPEDFMHQVTSENLQSFAEEIKNGLIADSDWNKYPRFKLLDDMSATVVEL